MSSTDTIGTNVGSTSGSGGGVSTVCEDDSPTGWTGNSAAGAAGAGGAAGAAGAAGASDGVELGSGFNFVDESEIEQWSIVPCDVEATDCVDEAAASMSFTCGVLQVEIAWPQSANTRATKLRIQNVVSQNMLRDLRGKTLYARVRMTSSWVAGAANGYDFNLIVQDYVVDDASNDWRSFSTCDNRSGNCPDSASGETFSDAGWIPLALPMRAELAPDDFAFDSVRGLTIEIRTKHWPDGEPFSYDSVPASFEVDYVAW